MKILDFIKAQTSCEHWVVDNCLFSCIHGSELYGANQGNSDKDVFGCFLGRKVHYFPAAEGLVNQWDKLPSKPHWIEHHIKDQQKKVEYDFNFMELAHYLKLCIKGNPNCVEPLFAPEDLTLHKTLRFQEILDIRTEFLTKKTIPNYLGYARTQLTKGYSLRRTGKRAVDIEKYGFDPKFLSHTVRLLLFAEQILDNRWLDTRLNKDMILSVKQAQWTPEDLKKWTSQKIIELDVKQTNSTLPASPNLELVDTKFKQILEDHYGNLSNMIRQDQTIAEQKLRRIKEICNT